MSIGPRFNFLKKGLCATTLLVPLVISTTSQAATPADAFQRAQYLGQMIERLLHSDLHEGKLSNDPAVSPSRPRHVLRLATAAYENVQFLRALNGLPEDKAINTKAKEVKPDDVINVLDAAIKSAKALAPVYQVDLNFTPPPLAAKKTPGEVMARLRAVNQDLIKLGTPKTLPNDVFRMSLGIYEQLKATTELRNIPVHGKADHVKKATPADALNEATALIADLDALSKSDETYALPSGVALPPKSPEGEPITPAKVLLATQFALADVYSLNVRLGYDKDLVLPPVQAGKNPADVKNMLSDARLHIKAIADSK